MDCQFNTYSDETVRLFFQVLVHILMTKISVYTFDILFTQKLAKKIKSSSLLVKRYAGTHWTHRTM